jgi:6-phosphogluconolactonase
MGQSKWTGYVGTYTKGDSEGIYTFTLDTEKKRLENVSVAAKLDNPTYVNISMDNRNLYAVVKEGSQGGVAAFNIEAETGALKEINRQLMDGASPCHVSVDSKKQTVTSANYHNGTITVYPVNPDGSLLTAASVVEHTGSGPNHARQEKPHVHFAGFTPDEKYIVTVDLGNDTLTTYTAEEGKLAGTAVLNVRPGSGPRHLAFHPNHKYAYIMTELSNEVIALQYDETSGSFKELQYISAIPEDFTENSQGSAIHVSADGRFVYAGNRGHDSIAVFSADPDSGKLTLVEYTSTEGEWPRDFVLDPSEKFLIASNQNSGNLVLFERDPETGRLSVLQKDVHVPDPVCVKFLHA